MPRQRHGRRHSAVSYDTAEARCKPLQSSESHQPPPPCRHPCISYALSMPALP
ncbi:hypothetical protein HMPREF1617_00175 [Escherichia coli 908675]|uniref:Uncharacterized protein n=1 Tax=Escherichia coli O1:H7 TaxID=2079151 RepID=A0A7G8AER8_ECOLX|nr:hypothetical protein HMPREF9536_03667 [Escherichia coli MS 84-1]EFU56421.1 hypothetical protein HMPREF9545_03834 [Escherichia coli MS 16-3]ESD12686.1 hypothetical protein HMPREF1590_00082 [Escherichia coli 113302]ESD79818.1 hypothetical protein HMPREF1609_00236 [Escherichia coli 908541]ESE23905.1 hypothetical protein HMPREF1617_00175 [Escherichia coli 908675]QNI18109.1 hypothetical protein [Escherichia coli O1:H7]